VDDNGLLTGTRTVSGALTGVVPPPMIWLAALMNCTAVAVGSVRSMVMLPVAPVVSVIEFLPQYSTIEDGKKLGFTVRASTQYVPGDSAVNEPVAPVMGDRALATVHPASV